MELTPSIGIFGPSDPLSRSPFDTVKFPFPPRPLSGFLLRSALLIVNNRLGGQNRDCGDLEIWRAIMYVWFF